MRTITPRSQAATCSFQGCGKPVSSYGLCVGHAEQRKRGTALRPLRTKREPNSYVLVGDVAFIILVNRSGQEAARVQVSMDDLSRVLPFRWCLDDHGYAMTHLPQKRGRLKLHRFVMDAPLGMEVDHVNGDPLDCRRLPSADGRPGNLRLVTHAQNAQNMVRQAGAMRNVYLNRRCNLYRVQVVVAGRARFFGSYRDVGEAQEAARRARAEVFTHVNESRHQADEPAPLGSPKG